MAIEAVCWISSRATEPRISGGIIPQECRSLARGTPHAGPGGAEEEEEKGG